MDREGKLLAQNVAIFKKKPIQSEYNSNFNEKSSIVIKKKRAQTANTTRSKATASEPCDVQKLDVWTRDSIINVSKMRQPESFAELIGGQYQKAHIEECQERDRVEHLNSKFEKGNPRIFRNFIDTNSNLLRK